MISLSRILMCKPCVINSQAEYHYKSVQWSTHPSPGPGLLITAVFPPLEVGRNSKWPIEKNHEPRILSPVKTSVTRQREKVTFADMQGGDVITHICYLKRGNHPDNTSKGGETVVINKPGPGAWVCRSLHTLTMIFCLGLYNIGSAHKNSWKKNHIF